MGPVTPLRVRPLRVRPPRVRQLWGRVAVALLLSACTAPGLSGPELPTTGPADTALGAADTALGAADTAPGAADTAPGAAAAEVSRAQFCGPASAWYVEAFATGEFSVPSGVDRSGPPPPALLSGLKEEFSRAGGLAARAAEAVEAGTVRETFERFSTLSEKVVVELDDPDLTLEALLLLLAEPAPGSAAGDLALLIYSSDAETLFDAIERSCGRELAAAGVPAP